jgi:hypothetical protein
MCLNITYNENGEYPAKVAEQDIVCYKILKKFNGEHYMAPYRGTDYKLDELYKSDLDVDHDSRYRLADVGRGLHSCVTLDGAEELAKQLILGNGEYYLRSMRLEFVICEAVIPAGSEYYVGDFENTCDSYASNALKVIKEI